jgi:hypothetical protein
MSTVALIAFVVLAIGAPVTFGVVVFPRLFRLAVRAELKILDRERAIRETEAIRAVIAEQKARK